MNIGKIPKLKEGIALDIDDTIALTFGYWIKSLKKKFKMSEDLTPDKIIKKYKLAQEVPCWQTKEALAWMENKRNSNDFQRKIPPIKDSIKFVKKINKLIPISVYITIRPKIVTESSKDWIEKYNYPEAPIILRPKNISLEKGNEWKARVLEHLYPKIKGIIDDNINVLKNLKEDYKGTFFLYNHNKINLKNSKINVFPCTDWNQVYKNIKNNLK